MTSDDTSEPSPAVRPNQTDSSEAPGLIDIPCEKQLMRRFSWGMVFVVMIPMIVLVIVLRRRGGTAGPVEVLASALVMVAVIVSYALFSKKRQVAVAERIVANLPDAGEVKLIEAFIARRLGLRSDAGVKALVKRMAEAGRRDVSVRVGPVKRAVVVDPIRVPFEPCLLDEAETGLVDLDVYTREAGSQGSSDISSTADTAFQAASAAVATGRPRRAGNEAKEGRRPKPNQPSVSAHDRANGADSPSTADTAFQAASAAVATERRSDEATEGGESAAGGDFAEGREDDRATTPSERRALRRYQRNMRVKGISWLLIAIFALNTVIAALESWQKGRVTWQLVYWPAFIVLMLYGPARGGWFRGSQWMAVPGGLVQRKGATLGKQWTVHVFDRRRSVLVVYRNFRQQWGFSVSDGEETGSGIGTHRETTLLLRAWLSPLEPPTVERLSDLA